MTVRKTPTGRASWLTSAIALVVALVTIAACGATGKPKAGAATSAPPTTPPTIQVTTTTVPSGTLQGSYTTTITDDDLAKGSHDAADIPGSWVIRIVGNGTMDVVLPDNIKVNFTYTQTGNQFVIGTDDHGVCNGNGTYVLAAGPASVTFKLLSDACAARAYLLPVHPWTKST